MYKSEKRSHMTADSLTATDGQLLAAFNERGDQAAFASVVQRHGAMVLQTARNVMRDHHTAEDVAQAVFLVLARKAGGLSASPTVAPWLYRVAHDLAVNAVRRRQRQTTHEREFALNLPSENNPPPLTADQRSQLSEQLRALPERYRAPLVLCYLEGQKPERAAALLGLEPPALRKRLERGRDQLRQRLGRAGWATSTGALASCLSAESGAAVLPATFVASTVKAASGDAVSTSVAVLSLTKEAMRMLFMCKVKTVSLTTAAAAVLAVAAIGIAQTSATPEKFEGIVSAPDAKPLPSAGPPMSEPASTVAETPPMQPQEQPTEAASKVLSINAYSSGNLYEALTGCSASSAERRNGPAVSCMQCHMLPTKSWPEITPGKPQDLSLLRWVRWGNIIGSSGGGGKGPVTVKIGQEFEIKLRIGSNKEGAAWSAGLSPTENFKEIKHYNHKSNPKPDETSIVESDDRSAEIVGRSVIPALETANFIPDQKFGTDTTIGDYIFRYRAVKVGSSEIRLHSFRQLGDETQYCGEYRLTVEVEAPGAPSDGALPVIRETTALQLAQNWATAWLAGNADEVLSLSDVPFAWDRSKRVKTIEELKKLIEPEIQKSSEELVGQDIAIGRVYMMDEKNISYETTTPLLIDTTDLVWVVVEVYVNNKLEGVMAIAIKPGNQPKVVAFYD